MTIPEAIELLDPCKKCSDNHEGYCIAEGTGLCDDYKAYQLIKLAIKEA